jgi:DNA-binding NarL/FixJ family response regulator
VTEAIRVVLADDHPLMLKAMDDLLRGEGGFRVEAQCPDGETALNAVRTYRPDILVLDLRMPRRDGISVLREIRSEQLPTRVVLLAASLDDEEMLEASRLGVGGVVLKEMAPRMLVQCIRKVHAGEPWIERRAAARMFEMLLRREAGAREISKLLTAREVDVLRMTASGLRNREIADRLHISEGTVKTHLHSIYEKIQVRSRAELIIYCRDKGLI